MIYTMLKSCVNNTEPKLLNYRDFKHFSQLSVIVVTHKMILNTFLHQSLINMLPEGKRGLGEIINPMLRKPYVRPL